MSSRDVQAEKIRAGQGFVAALDQSGGSTPKALKLYGIQEDGYGSEADMFDLIHAMRARIVTSPAFNGDKVVGAILFEMTMDRQIDDMPTAQYLWEVCGVVPFLKVDKGLADTTDGVKLMKLMPDLDALLDRAVAAGGGSRPRRVVGPARRGGAAGLRRRGRGGGGDNVVNVILVDFRGYDTLGDGTVLTIARLAVLAMLGPRRLRPAVTGSFRPPGVFVGPQPRIGSTMLRVAMRAILPLVLTFAAYVFFKGHQLPGGGFNAGLIASVGLAAYRMAEGREAMMRILPVKPAVVAALGLLIVLATAVAPMLAGLVGISEPAPLLTSAQWYIDRPGADPFHLPSVLFFDLGVFIVVVGVSTGMINRFEEELE